MGEKVSAMYCLKILTPVTVLLRRSRQSKPFVSHVDKIKLCYERDNEDNVVQDKKICPKSQAQPPPPNSDENWEGLRRSDRTPKLPSRLIEQC